MRLPLNIDSAMASAVWYRNLVLYKRTWKMNILPNFFEPLLYLLGMGFGLGAYLGEDVGGVSYIAYIAPGLLAASAMNGAVFEGTYNVYLKMHMGRIYDAFLGTRAQVEDIAFGELLWATTRAGIYGGGYLVIVATLSALGMDLITSPWALLLPLVIALTGLLFGSIALWFTSRISSIDLFSYFFALFYMPLFLFSGIFFPVEQFPGGEVIAWFLPLFHAVRTARAFAHGVVDWTHAASLLWMLVASGVAFAMVPRQLRKKLTR